MNEKSGSLLFIASSGMELSWLFAWATFITRASIHRPFPLPEAIFAFGLAALLLLYSRGKGWRIMTIIGLQTTGFILAIGRIVYVFYYRTEPFFNPNWVIDGFTRSRDPAEWMVFILVSFWGTVFWLSGATLARRSMSHLSVCIRFDLGVAAFVSLLVLKLVLRVRAGADLPDPLSEPLIFPFFAFALLAVGLARNRGSGLKNYLSGYGETGWILSFTAILLFLGTGSALLFLPYLTLAAEEGYDLLKAAAEPLGRIVAGIIRFIFLGRSFRMDEVSGQPGKSTGDLAHLAETQEQSPVWVTMMMWGGIGVTVIMALFLSAMGAWFLFRWLLSRDYAEKMPVQRRGTMVLFISWLWSTLLRLLGVIQRRKSGLAKANRIYACLRVWGKPGGVPCRRAETPTEYGFRLIGRFPSIRNEIGLIVDLFNQEAYGEISLGAKQLQESRIALKRLYSPRYWPDRARSRFLREDI